MSLSSFSSSVLLMSTTLRRDTTSISPWSQRSTSIQTSPSEIIKVMFIYTMMAHRELSELYCDANLRNCCRTVCEHFQLQGPVWDILLVSSQFQLFFFLCQTKALYLLIFSMALGKKKTHSISGWWKNNYPQAYLATHLAMLMINYPLFFLL